jgi:hypothetical protein
MPMKSNARPIVVLLGAALATGGLADIVPGPSLAATTAATEWRPQSPAPASRRRSAHRRDREMSGVHAGYVYIGEHYPGWDARDQAVLEQDGRMYDRINIVGPRGEKKTVYFDITDWFGK